MAVTHGRVRWPLSGNMTGSGLALESGGRPHRALASGRRGQQSSSRRSPQHDLCLVQHDLAVRLACPLRCRITPYYIKAAALRSAAPGIARGGLRPLGADPPRRAGHPGADPQIERTHREHGPTLRLGRLPRRNSVPVAAAASRAPTASHAIASRPLTHRPLVRDSAAMRRTGRE